LYKTKGAPPDDAAETFAFVAERKGGRQPGGLAGAGANTLDPS